MLFFNPAPQQPSDSCDAFNLDYVSSISAFLVMMSVVVGGNNCFLFLTLGFLFVYGFKLQQKA